MKKRIICLALLLVLSVSSVFVGCVGDDDGWDEDAEYTIQYTLDETTETIKVKNGELYSMPSVPKKFGYEFMGLFDSKVGGTQFIDETGNCLSAFTDKKNMTLYPQWKAKEFVIILDYQGAPVTGARSITVEYDGKVENLPLGLTKENKDFKGWFTEPDRGGEQIADEYGVLPQKETFNEQEYDMPETGNKIYLYAGFRGQMFNVTLYPDESGVSEEVQVEYGTDVKDIVCEKRVNGKAVYSWTKVENSGNVFSGKITGDTILYAVEYAPVIDFQTSGGNKINPLVEKSGYTITLPTPVRKNYTFGGWKTNGGTKVNYTVMPSESLTLFAIWKPMIVFNARGGTEVEAITQEVGTTVALPKTARSGYMFAGWYDESGKKYEQTSMPEESVVLSAKWYKVANIKKTIVQETDKRYMNKESITEGYRIVVDLSDLNLGDTEVKIKWTVKLYNKYTIPNGGANLKLFTRDTTSDAYLIHHFSTGLTAGELSTSQFETTTKNVSTIYVFYYGREGGSGWTTFMTDIKDIYIEVTYPDTTVLY